MVCLNRRRRPKSTYMSSISCIDLHQSRCHVLYYTLSLFVPHSSSPWIPFPRTFINVCFHTLSLHFLFFFTTFFSFAHIQTYHRQKDMSMTKEASLSYWLHQIAGAKEISLLVSLIRVWIEQAIDNIINEIFVILVKEQFWCFPFILRECYMKLFVFYTVQLFFLQLQRH